MSISRSDVINCYRYILGREPESENAIISHVLQYDSLCNLAQEFYYSEEYHRLHPGWNCRCYDEGEGRIRILAIDEKPALIMQGASNEDITEAFRTASRMGNQYLFCVNDKNEFQNAVVTEITFTRGLQRGGYFESMPVYVQVNNENTWKSEIYDIWLAAKEKMPNMTCLPVLKEGKIIAAVYKLSDLHKSVSHQKIDVDHELFKLIIKHGIYDEEPELLQYYYEKNIVEILNKMVESIPHDGKIALTSGNEESRLFLMKLSEANRERIKFILDDDTSHNLMDTISVPYSDIRQAGIRTVIFSSYKERERDKAKFFGKELYLRLIDPYDYLAQRNIVLSNGLETQVREFKVIRYVEVNNALWFYKKSTSIEKPFYLRRLIAYCIDIRNFIYAKRYMQEYIDARYIGKERYLAFMSDFALLEEQIRNCIADRHQADIIVNWIDATTASEFYDTDFAKKIKDDTLFFLQAYTQTAWTHYTHNAIFGGILPIEGRSFEKIYFNEDNSKSLKLLQENGYKFRYIANHGLYQEFFPKEWSVENMEGRVCNPIGFGRAASECSSRLYWLALRERLKEDRPICLWVHTLNEVHPDCGYIEEDIFSDPRKRHLYGLSFVSEQLAWYDQFCSPFQHDIYLSDHGPHLGSVKQKLWSEPATHVAMAIRSSKLKGGKIKGFYSHVDFYKVIEQLFSKKPDMQSICTDYVIGENPDWGNGHEVVWFPILWGSTRSIELMRYQHVWVRTNEDVYVHYAMGKELYYRLPDENSNLIDCPEWQDRIDYLRKLAPQKFIDYKMEPAFQECHRLYEYMKTLEDSEIPW